MWLGEAVISEDDVVDAVVAAIKQSGWRVISSAYAHEHGDDVVGEKGGATLRVEAKGAGSSKIGTNRYGLHFTSNQVRTHVAVATLRAMSWIDSAMSVDRAALAFPDDVAHRGQVAKIHESLRILGIGVFWVREDRTVTFEADWAL